MITSRAFSYVDLERQPLDARRPAGRPPVMPTDEIKGDRTMPKVSKESAPEVQDFGAAVDRTGHLDGYTVNFVSIRETHDLAPMLAMLSTGNCACHHWGYVVKGRITMRYPDHEEIVEAGDAFYFPPGHAPEAEAGTELVQFTPTDEMAALMTEMREVMAAQGPS
jgi:mannose-6-phosphate isomerase-like protein (cupin superfamily)